MIKQFNSIDMPSYKFKFYDANRDNKDEPDYKPDWHLTSDYINYLDAKDVIDLMYEVDRLYKKIQKDIKEYHTCDSIDYNNYNLTLKKLEDAKKRTRIKQEIRLRKYYMNK